MNKIWDSIKKEYIKVKPKRKPKTKVSANAESTSITINQIKSNRGLSTKCVKQKLIESGFKVDKKTVMHLINHKILKTRFNKVKSCSLWLFIKNKSLGMDLTEKTLKIAITNV